MLLIYGMFLQPWCSEDMSILIKMTSQHMYFLKERLFLIYLLLMDLVGNIRTLLDMKFNKGRPSRTFWASLLTWSWYSFPPSPLLLSSSTWLLAGSGLDLAPTKMNQNLIRLQYQPSITRELKEIKNRKQKIKENKGSNTETKLVTY